MGEKLKEYNKKRDFSKTSEPKGKQEKENQFRFCVQMHDASRLHFDFRIEHEGVLLSWAVPKGPSANPEIKHLAIQTEDHPVSYLRFEGTIPKGNYGGGSVILWDVGTYSQPKDKEDQDLKKLLDKQYKAGRIHLFFKGQKLKGEYSLIRTSEEKRHWLLLKVKDKYASDEKFSDESILSGRKVTEVKEEDNPLGEIMKKGKSSGFPEDFRPMLAKLSKKVFNDDQWLFEVKYDGYRCLLFKKEDQVRILSRNGINMNAKFPVLVEAASALPSNCVVDGEIIVADKTGGGNFNMLQQYLKTGKKHPLRLILFDLLYLEGKELNSLPLTLRKKALEKIMESIKSKELKYSNHILGKGKEYLDASKKMGLEGIIGKKSNSLYHKNKRSNDWLKFKNINDEDFIIVGLTPSPASRAFGSMLLAEENEEGKLQYAGKVGTGFGEKDMKDILKRLKKKESKRASVKIDEEVLFYTEPHYYAQVNYTEKTNDGKLRHPSFITIREDKFYSEEKETEVMQDGFSADGNLKAEPAKVELSNTDKIFFPKEKVSKGDIINYYQRVADFILPYLKDRPLTLKRTPNGIKDKGFYQKDVKDDLPDFVETKKISSKSSDKDFITYALCNNYESLIFLANYGCVEMHCWNSRTDQLENPDHIIFDLDPPGDDFAKAKEGAFLLMDILDSLEIHYGIKTSGSDGIHMYVPIQRNYTHIQARDAAHVIAKIWHKEAGKLGSLERSPAKRKTQVYLDYLQNAKGKTMACPFSLRVKNGVPVSMPLKREELETIQSPDEMNIASVPDLMKSREDPWKDLYKHRMKMEKIVEKVEAYGKGIII